jgi:hypothetical protein
MPASDVSDQFNIKYPHPRDLRTGDVLFPRKPKPLIESFFNPISLWSVNERQMTVGGLLAKKGLADLAPLDLPGLEFDTLYARPRRDLEMLEGADDRNNPARLLFLIRILRVAFRDLTVDWFGMTVDQFLRNPLVKVLMRALDGDILNNDGFFVGHCAIVLREDDGAHSDDTSADDGNGNVYVIEANVSDFDHYRVAIHPYHVKGDGADGRWRGWLNFRASQDNLVWHSRHTALDGAPEAAVAPVRQALLASAKTYLGTAYSFFDDSAFGHPGRLYCTEYVYRVFDDVLTGALTPPAHPELLAVDDTRTWQWMKDNNPRVKEGDMGDVIRDALADPVIGPHVAGKPFFILTVQMLWRSARLAAKFKPFGEPYA